MLFISQISGHVFFQEREIFSGLRQNKLVLQSLSRSVHLVDFYCALVAPSLTNFLNPPPKKIQSDWRLLRPLAVNALLWCQRLQIIRAIHNQKAFNSRNLPSWGTFQFPHRRGNRFLWAQCCRNFQLLIGGVWNFWIIWNIIQSLTS